MSDLDLQHIPQRDRRLGRHKVHHPASRAFPRRVTVDTTKWRTHTIRVWDPRPNPDQPVGNCTTCAKCSQHNAQGNRVKGVILNMDNALDMYEYETTIDPFDGYFKRGDPASVDTGSNGLSSCKTAQHFGTGGRYEWHFGGADEVVQSINDGDVPSLGTIWTWGMFEQDPRGVIEPTGGMAGGHQWVAIGHNIDTDLITGLCWWGAWRRFLISREHTDILLRAHDGDSHIQERLAPAA